MFDINIQKAKLADLKAICKFTDYWLAGRGIVHKAPGAVNDYFISPSQHKKYIEKYSTYIIHHLNELVAWAVIQPNEAMIHLLVSGYYRKRGIGRFILKELAPKTIHSKSNQSTGDPAPFYASHGYKKIKSVKARARLDIDKIRPDRKPIIDIFEKVC
jgi:hypothetical protein